MDPVFKVLAAMQDQADRLMAADRLDELGRPEAARLLRDPDIPPLVLCEDVLLEVRLGWKLNGVYAVQLFNSDGDQPAAYLTPTGPWRTWKRTPLGVAPRLRAKVVNFQFTHNNWFNQARRQRKEGLNDYLRNWAGYNNWWLLVLNAQDRKDFWEAVRPPGN
jgi:hypothetical protein